MTYFAKRYSDSAIGAPNVTRINSIQRRDDLGRVIGFFLGFLSLSVTAVTEASESKSFPLPFSGTFQSLASEARELTSRDKNIWATIPQNVFLTLDKDEEDVLAEVDVEAPESMVKSEMLLYC